MRTPTILAAAVLGCAVLTLPFAASMARSEPRFPFSVVGGNVTGDFNEDQHVDVAKPSSDGLNLEILLNRGDGTFTQGVVVPVPFRLEPKVSGDFNGDGHLDLALYDSQ